MVKIIQQFKKIDNYGVSLREAFTCDGGKTWSWLKNNSIISIEDCISYNIPCDKIAQRFAKDREIALIIVLHRDPIHKENLHYQRTVNV